jgi:hypothetical protein
LFHRETRLPDPETPAPDSVVVDCLTCHERIGVWLADETQTIRCTFCQAPVQVPSREQVRLQRAAKAGGPAKVEEYAIAPSADEVTAKPAATKTVRSGAAGKSGSAPTVTLECPTCHELVKARVGPKPGKITCTFCEVVIAVPDLQTVAGWRAKTVTPRSGKEIGEYSAGPITRLEPLRADSVFDRLAEVRQEAAIPPPRWTFFSSVFTLPWHAEAVARWVYMSIGFTAILGIAVVLKSLAAQFSGMASGVAVAFFLLPIIWITYFTMSYAAACSLHVFESTAAGLDRIEAWPEPNWRDWMGELIYVGWIAVIPLGISYGLGLLGVSHGVTIFATLPALFFVLYPISFLSAMEANSVWVPLTMPILGSLARWWWCWLLFYCLAGLMIGSIAAAVILLIASSLDGLLIGMGPVLAAGALIYFRLLGRLAWRMTAKMKTKKKKSPNGKLAGEQQADSSRRPG